MPCLFLPGYPLWIAGWNYLSVPKCQRCNRWRLKMHESYHPTLYWACDYLSTLGLKLIHVSKRDPRLSRCTIRSSNSLTLSANDIYGDSAVSSNDSVLQKTHIDVKLAEIRILTYLTYARSSNFTFQWNGNRGHRDNYRQVFSPNCYTFPNHTSFSSW